MRISTLAAAAPILILAACGSADEAPPVVQQNDAAPAAPGAAPPDAAAPAAQQPGAAGAAWDLVSSGEGDGLMLRPASGPARILLFCPADARTLLVNVPGFRAIGSEERLSFGSGGTVVALVADTRGDRLRGGVSGTGAVPGELAAILSGPVSASYGAQTSGPHPAPPAELARGFVAACREGPAATPPPRPQPQPKTAASPCMTQGSDRLQVRPMRAVGTEPFWGARIEGRCVTYAHPENQAGTRVWTRYVAGANGGGTWTGALEGRAFELRLRAQPGCSDGMSDRRYPFAADLLVGGERRTGCAEPL